MHVISDLTVPDVDRSYPVRQSTQYVTVAARFHEWFSATELYKTEREFMSFEAKDYPYLASIAWPACDERLLWEFTALAATMTERDDDWAAHWEPLVAEVWRRLAEHVPPRQMSRLTEAVSTYRAGCSRHEQELIQGYIPQDIGDYLSSRHHTVGQLIDHVLVEISLGIDVSDTLSHPLMDEMVRRDIDRVIACQDLLSARKELRDGDQENLVWVIATTTGCSVQDAVALACLFLKEAMSNFDDAAAEVLRSPLGSRRDVRQFIKGLNDFVAGLIEWTSCSSRYTLRARSHWTTTPVPYHPEA